jgi:hypothetical protein
MRKIYFQDSTPHIANKKGLPEIQLAQAFNNLNLLKTALSKR